jgi:hypothetical protein
MRTGVGVRQAGTAGSFGYVYSFVGEDGMTPLKAGSIPPLTHKTRLKPVGASSEYSGNPF